MQQALFWVALAAVCFCSAVDFVLCWADKRRARKGAWRVKEATLLLWALAGGCFGLWIGMQCFRHKTQHRKFTVLTPLFCMLWVGALVGLLVWWGPWR